MSAEDSEEWVNCNKSPSVTAQMKDDKIVHRVMNPEDQEEEYDNDSDIDGEEIQEIVTVDEIIKFGELYIQALEQRNLITHQHIMNIYLVQTVLRKERPKHMKHLTMHEMSSKSSKQCVGNPVTTPSPTLSPNSDSEPELQYFDCNCWIHPHQTQQWKS